MVDRISTSLFHETSLHSMLSQQQKVTKSQTHLSTMKKILSPSDDPIGVSRLLNLKSHTAKVHQYQTNAKALNSKLSVTETHLQSIQKILTHVRERTIQANSSNLSYSDKKLISDDIRENLNELKSIVNTKYNGEYLFGGYQSTKPPASKLSDGSYKYNGDEGVDGLQVGATTIVSGTNTAKELFFEVSASNSSLKEYQGLAKGTSAGASTDILVAQGSLTGLSYGDLNLNGVIIDQTIDDGISSTDGSASAISISNAINAKIFEHGVYATPNQNVIDLGNFTAGTLAAGDFKINGFDIIDPTSTEDSLIQAINDKSADTGVVATQPLGNGNPIILTAIDGRNIQLETDGVQTDTANFSNFDLSSGALDQVQRASVTISDHENITISGSNPQSVDFNLGVVSVSANAGTANISTPAMVKIPPDSVGDNETYLIKFIDATTYSIFKESDLKTPINGYENLEYVSGDAIEVEGLGFSISGIPSAEDTFTIKKEPVVKQNIFQTIEDLLVRLNDGSIDYDKQNYDYNVILGNIVSAQDHLSGFQSSIGARLNTVASQEQANVKFLEFAEKARSDIEDLDMTEAITKFTQHMFALQAAQGSFMKIQNLSLFNYL